MTIDVRANPTKPAGAAADLTTPFRAAAMSGSPSSGLQPIIDHDPGSGWAESLPGGGTLGRIHDPPEIGPHGGADLHTLAPVKNKSSKVRCWSAHFGT